jgi:hypothetical protein
MSDSAQTALLLVVALVSLAGLVVATAALRRTPPRAAGDRPLPDDVAGLRAEVERLRGRSAGAMRHCAVVRYDAFGDMGGRLSWSLALADESGDGVVLSSIAGRSEARTYAKPLAGWASDQPLSPEEESAVAEAKAARRA